MAGVFATGQLFPLDRAQAVPWALQSSLTVSEQYHDNVFLSTGPNDPTNPERSDMVTVLSPALTISRKTERLTATIRYQPSFNFYARYHNELNYITQAGQATLGVKGLGPGALQDTRLDVTEAFVYTQQSLYNFPLSGGVAGNGGIITQRSNSWSNAVTATLTQPLTSTLQGIATYNNTISRYKNPGLIDSNQQGFSLGLRDRWTQYTTVIATYNYANFDYNTTNYDRQSTHSISVGIDHAVTPTLQTQISVGGAYLSFNNSYYPIGSVSVTKQFRYTLATMGYNSGFSTGGGITQVPTITQNANFALSRVMGPNAHANVSGDFTNQRSTTTPTAVTNSFTIVGSADYAVTKWLQAIISYNHSAQQGNNSAAGQDIRWNTVALTLDGKWDIPTP